MTKINLFDLNHAFLNFIDMYINKETGEIIEDYDHHLLSKEIQKQYIISPKFTKKDLIKIMEEYIEENNITTYIYNKNDDVDVILQNFDYWVKDNNLLDNYIEFLRKKEYEILIEQRKKNNFDYYYEEPTIIKESVEEYMEDLVEKAKIWAADLARQEYYRDYEPKNIK